jgi:hypothetical protein
MLCFISATLGFESLPERNPRRGFYRATCLCTRHCRGCHFAGSDGLAACQRDQAHADESFGVAWICCEDALVGERYLSEPAGEWA